MQDKYSRNIDINNNMKYKIFRQVEHTLHVGFCCPVCRLPCGDAPPQLMLAPITEKKKKLIKYK